MNYYYFVDFIKSILHSSNKFLFPLIFIIAVSILTGVYIANQNIFNQKNNSQENSLSPGNVLEGDLYDPRSGLSCPLSFDKQTCIDEGPSGFPCTLICCGIGVEDSNKNKQCFAPGAYPDKPYIIGARFDGNFCSVQSGQRFSSIFIKHFGKPNSKIELSLRISPYSDNSFDSRYKKIDVNFSPGSIYAVTGIELLNENGKYKITNMIQGQGEDFVLEQTKTYYVRVFNGQYSQYYALSIPNCDRNDLSKPTIQPTPTSVRPPISKTGLLVNVNAFTKKDQTQNRAFMYRGMPNKYLDTVLYAPFFFTGAYGYNSSFFISNSSNTPADLRITYDMLPTPSNGQDQTLTENINISSNTTLEINKSISPVLSRINGNTRYSVIITSTNGVKISGAILTWKNNNCVVDETRNRSNGCNLNDRNNVDDIFADPLLSKNLASNTLIQMHLSCYFGSDTIGWYNSGHTLINTSDQPKEAIFYMFDRSGEKIGELRKTLNSFDTQQYYAPVLMDEVKINENGRATSLHDKHCLAGSGGGFSGSLVISTVDKSSSLVGGYHLSRDGVKGRGQSGDRNEMDTASLGMITPQDSSSCSYDFPLYWEKSFSPSLGLLNSGISIHSAESNFLENPQQDIGKFNLSMYPGGSTQNPQIVPRDFLKNNEVKLELITNLPLEGRFKENQPFASEVCSDSNKKLVSSLNTRRDNNPDFLGFGDSGFSEPWIDTKWVIPYVNEKLTNFSYQGYVNLYNPSDKTLDFTITNYQSGALPGAPRPTLQQTIKPHELKSYPFENLSMTPTSTSTIRGHLLIEVKNVSTSNTSSNKSSSTQDDKKGNGGLNIDFFLPEGFGN